MPLDLSHFYRNNLSDFHQIYIYLGKPYIAMSSSSVSECLISLLLLIPFTSEVWDAQSGGIPGINPISWFSYMQSKSNCYFFALLYIHFMLILFYLNIYGKRGLLLFFFSSLINLKCICSSQQIFP